MAGFTNYNKLKPGDIFTVKGEHFRKLTDLWYKSIENAPLGEQMMTYATDALINQPEVEETTVKGDIDCSAKIVDADGKRVIPPSARKLAEEAQTPVVTTSKSGAEYVTGFKSKSEAKRVTAMKAVKKAKTARKKAAPRKAAKKQAKRRK